LIALIDDDNVGTVERGREVRIVDKPGNEVAPGDSAAPTAERIQSARRSVKH
jgi:hypothetical protein